MTTTRVRSLRLTAADDGLVARGRFLVEDALRTMSLGVPSGATVAIRRIALGVIASGAAPSSIARTLESQLRELLSRAVPGESPQAEAADLVWFNDRVSVRLAAAQQLAQGRMLTAWYWPSVLPALHGSTDLSAQTHAVLSVEGEATEEGLGERVLLATTLAERGLLRPLLELVPDARLVLLDDRSAPTRRREDSDSARGPAPLDGVSALGRLLVELVHRLGPHDRRSRWVGEVLALRSRHGGAASGDLAREASRVIAAAQLASPLVARRMGAADRPAVLDTSLPVRQHRGAEGHNPLAPSGAAEASSGSTTTRHTNRSPPTGSELAPMVDDVRPAAFDRAPVTQWASLFFLVNAFTRLRIAEWWVSSGPDTGHPCHRLMRHIAARLGIEATDPVFAVLGGQGAVDPEGDRWWRVIRAWLRRTTTLRALELAKGRGTVHVTATHLDVTLPFRSIDVRVRRAGLDLDPGWVPWLERAVAFRYAERL